MAVRIGINGFGRMGRLALRAAWGWEDIEIVHINEKAGDAATAAHLLQFDSVHGQWNREVRADDDALIIDGKRVSYSSRTALEDGPWQQVDLVVECTGKFKSKEALQPYLDAGVRKVVVSAPVKDGTLNVVMGVNDDRYDGSQDIITAASCTTNCLAPVVDVIHKEFGIRHGSITTIHDITNTQSILDEYHKDLRRARASSMSLIPTSTGSATAITEIFPELKGRLNGVAVRVPLANASLTDCVFEIERRVTVEQVNEALKAASQDRLSGVLGYEERPLVSVDYTNDTRSSVVDAPSTMVINGTQVKILAWYDNEVGYVNRMMELAAKVARSL
ncbi:ArsJ-associated glyceraldehyde-3-phosphate dehydrogenase [Pseudomaricurvus alkylphenolicus]|uniref:ArsJ-associated glyceraldehyde-3-phosphate dehydrogenase n=1 Tax=Pseudomaricurvus alkylphenolicus TaxID=1306991 RepID=UPI00142172D2|nr:ArsJ-associated glyceraldehyde-3-phosphate dehydrogenase [Pseudomaricurvus alkylphenolicus]NIB39291.1 ArsJ-associated glyceraldehyde-3-phosphate dehydrogenase [Pseudomaricurvus alkylphenolicus]